MKRTALLLVAAAVITTLAAQAIAQGHPAPIVVDMVWGHVGGKDNYEKVRYLEFTWAYEADGEVKGARNHVWDRYTGDYVLEMKDRDTGDDIKVYFNVQSKEGVALVNGEPFEADAAREMLDRAYGVYINDTYWLLAPLKLDDYGVRLKALGHSNGETITPFDEPTFRLDSGDREHRHEQTDKEREAERQRKIEEHGDLIALHVFFDGDIGLTPGDQYWFFITHDGEVKRWRYELESGRTGEYDWVDEKDCGMGVMMSTRKQKTDGTGAIVFPNVRFSETMDRSVFEYSDES